MIKQCNLCRKEYTGRKLRKFCSKRCNALVNSVKNGIATRLQPGHTRSKRLPNITCQYCSKEFHPSSRHIRFCSRSCASKLNKSATQFKKGFVPWNKGLSNGGTLLRDMIENLQEYKNWRQAIYDRDDYICQLCGKRGGKLNAHHKKTFKALLKEHNIKTVDDALKCKALWNIDNGATLCVKCHNIFRPSVVWIRGEQNSGKTTLAKQIQRLSFRSVVLDGDEMRWAISPDLGFSSKDRVTHNIKIAKLAKILKAQYFNVVVATICPDIPGLHDTINKITKCRFINL